MSQWTDNDDSQWVDNDDSQWIFIEVVEAIVAIARFITKKSTFHFESTLNPFYFLAKKTSNYFTAIKNTFHFKSKESNYYDITKENK